MNDVLNTILQFFQEISLPYRYEALDQTTFLPGIKIESGVLLIDLDKLVYKGDLLHEAGHIAVTAGDVRHILSGDVAADGGDVAGEEMAAIAWSWAALTYLKLPPELVFHPNGYSGGSANYIEGFQRQGGFGHPLLSYFNMCLPCGCQGGYPLMQKWLRG